MPKEEPKKRSATIYIVIAIIVGIFLFSILVPVIFLSIIGLAASGGVDTTPSGSGNVAHLELNGVIVSSAPNDFFSQDNVISADTVVSTLEDIKDDKKIKGVIIQINSPGGSGVASDEIGQALQQLEKPSVVYVREVAASGGYWIASSADYIVANRMSIVGSIGVIGSYLDFSDFLTRYNVSYQRFVAGKNKDFGSPFIEPTQEQEEHFQEILDQMHSIFIEQVAQGRDMSFEEMKELADGSIYSGMQGKELGLVDELGGKQEAITYMENILGEDISLIEYSRPMSFFDILTSAASQQSYTVGQGLGDALVSQDQPLVRT